MLSSDVPIESLNALRKQDVPKKITRALNNEPGLLDEQRPGFMLPYIFKKQWLGTYFFPEALTQVFYVNDQFIADQKSAACDQYKNSNNKSVSIPFVSTNDVLMSELLKCMCVRYK